MRVLLQDIESSQFVSRDGEWTPDPDGAKDFGFTTYAFDCGIHVASGPFRVVLHLPGTGETIGFIDGRGRARKTAALSFEV